MNYWKRARNSIFRTKGKSLILFAVIFVLGNVIAGAIAIQQSTTNVEKKMKQQLGATVSAEPDLNELLKQSENGDSQSMTQAQSLKEETIKKIGASPYVKDYDYSYLAYLNVNKFKIYEMKQQGNMEVSSPYKTMILKGSNSTEPMDFKNKKVKLVDGRMLTKEELKGKKPMALISKKVADENGLSVGDQMVLDTVTLQPKDDGTMDSQDSTEHAVKIVGLFEPIKLEKKKKEGQNGQDALNQQITETDMYNTAFVSNGLAREINKIEMSNMSSDLKDNLVEEVSPIFTLKSPEDVAAFKAEIKPLLPEGYKAVASTDEFDKVGASVKRLSKISGYVVILAVLASLLIISLAVVLFMKDRRHEWGIYLSLGEHRKNIMKQVVAELLVISIAALLISLVSGNVLGKMVSESLIAGDTMDEVAQNVGSQVVSMGGATSVLGSSLSNEDVMNNYEVRFSMTYIVTFMIAGIGTILSAAILPLTYVMRLNPKKIMM
ncbi:ABC transporter permease [Enterococcus sp. AZ007]|uniref:ABC transporter permease n=1 Tax=Enterococcus sp. AZ007 TaxID=2774839 RepID=UPI003F1EF670